MTAQRPPPAPRHRPAGQSQPGVDMRRYPVLHFVDQSEIRSHNHAPEPCPRTNGVSCAMYGEREAANQTADVIPGALQQLAAGLGLQLLQEVREERTMRREPRGENHETRFTRINTQDCPQRSERTRKRTRKRTGSEQEENQEENREENRKRRLRE
ncbi:hypothetical protein EYF80_036699 [Liparis tanakae]|uniref:Uncharacterized protein n=1 Tax=Liparis tanakae TaxID=230148 RepID=A0A4Z2GHT6_9TELE|nr:hypothetical protein EYF80_036699 [Liparis tanakae]